jgi:paraquat-inducible protein A
MILDNMQRGYEYHCPRCDCLVYRPGESKRVVSSLTISSLVIFFWAITEPIFDIFIISPNSSSIIESINQLLYKDLLSGILMMMTIVIVPFVMMILTLGIIYHDILKIKRPMLKAMINTYIHIKEWNMIEVYFVGFLISMIKLVELSDMTIAAGFWINAIYVILLYISVTLFNPYDILHIHARKPIDKDSTKKTLLYLLLALIFIPVSNMLPIMPTYKYSVEYPNTIIDGIEALYLDGDYFIAGVIFFTTLCIPFIKILSVVVVIIMAEFKVLMRYRKVATKYFIVTDALGKYSMLDVYVVVLSAAFIQYDNLVRIEIGSAIIPFTFVVFFTMIANKVFDTRLIWKDKKV